MTDNPQKNDPSSDWSEEIKQAYEHLKIPSLYESVLANEKLSLEIKRQSREIKNLSAAIQGVGEQLNAVQRLLAEGWHGFEGEEVSQGEPPGQEHYQEYGPEELTELEVQLISERQAYLEKQSLDALMESHDAVRELSSRARKITQQIFILLPKKEGVIPRAPVWYPVVQELVYGFVEAVDDTRFQLLAGLKEQEIELIEPQPGDPFDETQHHVLDYALGGKPGTIEKVVRAGYRKKDEIIRLSDVIVFR